VPAETDAPDAVDRLYAVKPADFVKERNAAAKMLKAAGKREEAARALKLPRPTPSVWAVNQLARHVPALVQRLVEATARLQAGGEGTYAEALAAHRDVLKQLRAKGDEILAASEMRPTLDVLTRVVHDLRAGVLNPESRSLIESGRLERDVPDEGAANPFEQELPFAPPAAAQLAPTAGQSAPGAAPKPAPAADAGRARRAEVRAIEEARVARLRRLKQLREAVAAAETARERDAKAVEGARRLLSDAEAKLTDAEAALAKARTALAAAEAEAG
jgi:hypothetical protein